MGLMDPVDQLRYEEQGMSADRPVKRFRRRFPERTQVRLHYHYSLEVNLCDTVVGTMRVGERLFDLSRIRLAVLPPGVLHSYDIRRNDGEIDVVHIALGLLGDWIAPEKIAEHTAHIAPERLVFSRETPVAAWAHTGPGTTFGALAYAFRILDLVSDSDAGSEEHRPSWLRAVVDYTEERYAHAITLEQAAGVAGLSRSGFARLFRERTGTTYHRFLVQVRIERAKQALLAGRDVTRVAQDTGFSDASHFVRAFRAEMGVTPGTWQKQ
jgi:AraC-like DNA-binding protein